MYIIPLLLSFFLALVGLSLGSPISNYIDTLELYYGERFGVKNTFFKSFVSTLHSFVHWGSWESFTNYTLPFFSGVLIGLVLFFFPETHGVKLYGCLLIVISIAGVIVYCLPDLFNNINDWTNIVMIPISVLSVIGGVAVAKGFLFLFRNIM